MSLTLSCAMPAFAQNRILRHSDVVFMYQAGPKVYQAYGATVLAWGGKPTPQSIEQNKGIKVFGSVGMVTEFSRYYERFPTSYEEGLCRDINGNPVKVPWLTDHQHKGVPYWWCCTQQPQFRTYISERVVETIQGGADGIHIDDHMGTSGGLWLGVCFCDRCVAGFRTYLATLPESTQRQIGITELAAFDYRKVVREWLAADAKRKTTEHPLWAQWTVYQTRAAAEFMKGLKALAARTAGRPVPMGANAGLLWPRHLADYQSLDLFSAETDHHAAKEHVSTRPIFAYRLADAVRRPYAATASGGDWAYIKERNLPGLVQSWIALSYAAGHCLMAPNRQWCYTQEKGTHWYDGPAEKFVPLYQFVRRNAELFDGYESLPDLTVVLPHASFLADSKRWFDLCQELAARNISYNLALGGDEIVDHPLSLAELKKGRGLLVPDHDSLLEPDRAVLDRYLAGKTPLRTVAEVQHSVVPAVQVTNPDGLQVFPRVKQGRAVVHFVNLDYDPQLDQVRPISGRAVKLNTAVLGVSAKPSCRWTDLDGARDLEIADGVVKLPNVSTWGILSLW